MSTELDSGMVTDSRGTWHVYFDTNSLLSAGWPADMQSLLRLKGLAYSLQIELFLPKPVQVELEEVWVRGFVEKNQGLSRAGKDLSRHVVAVLAAPSAPPPITPEEARARYRERDAFLREKFHIQVSAITTKSVEAFVAMAARRESPFGSDAMFRDAAILWSVFEHARSLGSSSTCILITADGALRKPEIAEIAEREGLQFSTFGTINELNDELAKSLRAVVQEDLEADKANAGAALEAARGKIEGFINSRLEIPEHELQTLFGTVDRITHLDLVGFTNVRTPFPLPEEIETQIAISVDVSLRAHVVVRRLPPLPTRILRVGDAEGAGERSASPLFWTPEPVATEETFELKAELEAMAHRSGGGAYSEIVPQSVQLKPSLGGLLQALAQAQHPS